MSDTWTEGRFPPSTCHFAPESVEMNAPKSVPRYRTDAFDGSSRMTFTDPAGTFDAGAERLLAHYGSTDQAADWQLAELAVHTWDLATATGQPVDSLDPGVAERGLAFMTKTLKPEMRSTAFGPEQPAPAGASAYERIAAFAGRRID